MARLQIPPDPLDERLLRGDRVGWVRDALLYFWSSSEIFGRLSSSIGRQERSTPARVAALAPGVVIDREDPFATTTADDQVHADLWRSSAGLIAGAAFLATRSMASSNRGLGGKSSAG
jgi:hypothetical protein